MKLLDIHGGRAKSLGRGKGCKSSGIVVAQAMVDDCHFAKLSKYSWFLNMGYPCVTLKLPNGRTRNTYLHQVVWLLSGNQLPQKPNQIDHEDRDKLNAQIFNLREATRTLQKVNVGLTKSNTTGRKGVCWHKKGKKWEAKIFAHGKKTHLGLFSDIDEAAQAYREAHIRIHGIPPAV